jgi:hypothetical protein
MWQSMDALHDEYEEGKAKHKGKSPVIGIAEWARVSTRQGTSYRPIFEITSWVPTPKEFGGNPTHSRGGRPRRRAA